jgi:hypothetical protein
MVFMMPLVFILGRTKSMQATEITKMIYFYKRIGIQMAQCLRLLGCLIVVRANMNSEALDKYRVRTDAKLRYAKVHLNQLKELSSHGGDDYDRAHQESFLYHLLGAKDAFLQELNVYYSCGLDANSVSPGKLREEIKKKGKSCAELAELYSLENDGKSWLFHAKEMRDHSTHISHVPRAFHCGGENSGKVFLRNPATNQEIQTHFVDEFDKWQVNMEELLERLRGSAIKEFEG